MSSETAVLRVLLVHMPIANPVLPNLAIELLAQIARDVGHKADVLYGTFLMPPGMSFEQLYGMVGQSVFAPDYFGLDEVDYAQTLVDAIVDKQVSTKNESDMADSVVDFLMSFDAAKICLDRCLDQIPVGAYDLIGFSVAFDAQKLPSAALARRLKLREPGLKILFGGTGCDGEMAPALLERFPEVDAVLKGEGDTLFLPVAEALVANRALDKIGQLAWRTPESVICVNPDRPAFNRMDSLPEPDYRPFLEQRAASPYAIGPVTLMFEGSRGCWWGDKQHCEFCGIRAVRLGFRSRDADGVLKSIDHLVRFGAQSVYATDAILDLNHMRNVLPALARKRRQESPAWKLFYEIKSNAKRSDYALMAAAGVGAVQPGIESFSSAALKRIRKGATGLQQVAALKWCATYDINVIFGILVGLPGESARELRDMIATMRRLHHLCAPVAANPLALHSFSPYAADPAKHGIRDIAPFPLQRLIYQSDDALLSRLCYELDFRIEGHDDPDYLAAREEIAQEVLAWQSDYVSGHRLFVLDRTSGALLVRRTPERGPTLTPLERDHSAVLRACTGIASTGKIAAQTGLSEAATRQILEEFSENGIVLEESDNWLSLAVPQNACAWNDSGLGEEGRLDADGPATPALVMT